MEGKPSSGSARLVGDLLSRGFPRRGLAIAATGYLLSQGTDAREAARYVGPILGLIALYLGLSAWVRRGSARFAVTNKRVFSTTASSGSARPEILLSQVEGIAVTRGPWARGLWKWDRW